MSTHNVCFRGEKKTRILWKSMSHLRWIIGQSQWSMKSRSMAAGHSVCLKNM